MIEGCRGNFAIVSIQDEDKKIGSISLSLTTVFDTVVSRLVREAEEKILSGEIDIPVEEYVTARYEEAKSREKVSPQALFAQQQQGSGDDGNLLLNNNNECSSRIALSMMPAKHL